MARTVTIVMYHFVRDLRRSRYPAIKGLETADFRGQLEYFRRHHNVIRMEDVLAAADDPDVELPERAVLLTFDDGYADHYRAVFPLLDRHGFQGSFYPPARAILERRVLDVNKIHFLLAVSDDDVGRVVAAMEAHVDAARGAHDLPALADYRTAYAHANRWDPAEVIYVKRLLQRGLPTELRATIVAALFHEFVAADEAMFADELYVDMGQLRTMRHHGMHVGSHSYDHVWLDTLTAGEQTHQVHRSMDFLRQIGCDMDDWTLCYPYGGFDEGLLAVLAEHHCRLGLSTELAVADLDDHRRLALPRIDANDVPTDPNADPAAWTFRAS